MTDTLTFNAFDLLRALTRYQEKGGDMLAPVFIEQSGDSDFSPVIGVKGYTVTDTASRKDCMCLDIGHGQYHHPGEAWP